MLNAFQDSGARDALTTLGLLKLGKAHKLHERRVWHGLKISIENRKGSRRYWKDPNSKDKGSTYMHYPYGYIRMTEGSDGDHIDVYLGPNINAKNVYVVNQMKKPEGSTRGDGKRWSEYDEQKCMLGFNSAKEAKAAYIKQYNDPRFFGNLKTIPFTIFKAKALRSLVGGRHKIAEPIQAIHRTERQIRQPKSILENSSLIGVTRRTTDEMSPEDKLDRAFHFHAPSADNEPAVSNSQNAPSGLII